MYSFSFISLIFLAASWLLSSSSSRKSSLYKQIDKIDIPNTSQFLRQRQILQRTSNSKNQMQKAFKADAGVYVFLQFLDLQKQQNLHSMLQMKHGEVMSN